MIALDVRTENGAVRYIRIKNGWIGFIPLVLPMFEKQENKILYPTNFSPIK